MLVSSVQQSDSVIYQYIDMYIFKFFSVMAYYKVLNIVLCCVLKLKQDYKPWDAGFAAAASAGVGTGSLQG